MYNLLIGVVFKNTGFILITVTVHRLLFMERGEE